MQIGVALSNTMLLNSFATQLPFLVVELCVLPMYRWYRALVRVSQLHLNKVYAPSSFRLHTRLATVVNTLIITLFFSPALPLLMPFALIFFIFSIIVDKLLVFRFCRTPPAYDARLVAVVIQMLPYILLCHLVMAVWVYANSHFFPSGVWLPSFGPDKVDVYQHLESLGTNTSVVGHLSRLFRYNTLPFTVLFVLFILAKVVTMIGWDIFASIWRKVIEIGKRCCGARGNAAFVGDEDELKSPTTKGITTKLNNHPPFSRQFEVLYENRKMVPAFTPER